MKKRKFFKINNEKILLKQENEWLRNRLKRQDEKIRELFKERNEFRKSLSMESKDICQDIAETTMYYYA